MRDGWWERSRLSSTFDASVAKISLAGIERLAPGPCTYDAVESLDHE